MKKYGLVLEGGGTKGAYQFGAWQAFKELGIEISGVVGTSIGALNGALIIQDDYELCRDLWYNIKPSSIFNIEPGVYEHLKSHDYAGKSMSQIVKEFLRTVDSNGLDISSMKSMIKHSLDEEKVRNSDMDFGLVTISISDKKALEVFKEDIPAGLMKDFLLATAYLPVFQKERLHGKYYLDGGYYNNLPTNMLVDKGYKDIIEVKLNNRNNTYKPDDPEVNIITIEPTEDLGMALDFDVERARRNIQLGYYDTMKVMRGLRGTHYYIEMDLDESKMAYELFRADPNMVRKLHEVLGLREEVTPRSVFEVVVPKLIDLCGMDEQSTYSDVVVMAYEVMAEKCGVEKFQVYKMSEFLNLVRRCTLDTVLTVEEEQDFLTKLSMLLRENKVLYAMDTIVRDLDYMKFK